MDQPTQALDKIVCDCTVRVHSHLQDAYGTGFFVGQGLILTCAHVIEMAWLKSTTVKIVWNGQSHPSEIHTFLAPPYPDLALLRIDLQQHPCVYLHEDIELKDYLSSYGYTDICPEGESATFEYEGSSSEPQKLLKLKDGQVRPGLSGAPLLNLRTGGVCGIVKSSRDRVSDLGGRAIPTSTIYSQLNELNVLQQQFHQKNLQWIDCLTPQQRQQAPWQATATLNPFYRESPQLLGRTEEIQKLLDKLRARNHCSILGPPGSGKSLLLSELQEQASAQFGWTPQEMCLVNLRLITNLRELQGTIAAYLGGQNANEILSLLRPKSLRLLMLNDLGGMDPGKRGYDIRRWLRGIAEGYEIRLVIVSNEKLENLFHKDDPLRDSPFVGIDPSPIELAPLPTDTCHQIVEQRLVETSCDLAEFADLLKEARFPRDLLNRCAARFDELIRRAR